MKTYKTAADILTAIHLAWSFLVIGGAFFEFLVPSYALTQIIVMSITLLIGLPFGACPLTALEKRWRRKTNPSYDNQNSFITTYANKIMGAHLEKRTVNIAIGVFYTISYLSCAYNLIFHR